MKKRTVFIISGRVQGVLFRAFTKGKAEKLGLSGYVQNLDDGTVRVEAEGEEQALETFKTELRKGSRWSRVENVVCEESDNIIGYKDFKIKYKSFLDRF